MLLAYKHYPYVNSTVWKYVSGAIDIRDAKREFLKPACFLRACLDSTIVSRVRFMCPHEMIYFFDKLFDCLNIAKSHYGDPDFSDNIELGRDFS